MPLTLHFDKYKVHIIKCTLHLITCKPAKLIEIRGMLYGQDLLNAITEMGLSERQFAMRTRKPSDGKPLSPTAIGGYISNPHKKAGEDAEKAVEFALARHCRLCGHYTEKSNAWDNPTPAAEDGGRKRKG